MRYCSILEINLAQLPYVTAPGNIKKALDGIKSAATPSKLTQDFVKTVLKVPGGSGDQITSFLKKIGFANADGSLTEIYTKFRNPTTSGRAVASAIKKAYAPLYVRNEYMHELNDDELRGLIVEETGSAHDSKATGYIHSAVKHLKAFSDFSEEETSLENTIQIAVDDSNEQTQQAFFPNKDQAVRLNLGYTINLNLPATSDIEVFNAIFKSLKEHILKD